MLALDRVDAVEAVQHSVEIQPAEDFQQPRQAAPAVHVEPSSSATIDQSLISQPSSLHLDSPAPLPPSALPPMHVVEIVETPPPAQRLEVTDPAPDPEQLAAALPVTQVSEPLLLSQMSSQESSSDSENPRDQESTAPPGLASQLSESSLSQLWPPRARGLLVLWNSAPYARRLPTGFPQMRLRSGPPVPRYLEWSPREFERVPSSEEEPVEARSEHERARSRHPGTRDKSAESKARRLAKREKERWKEGSDASAESADEPTEDSGWVGAERILRDVRGVMANGYDRNPARMLANIADVIGLRKTDAWAAIMIRELLARLAAAGLKDAPEHVKINVSAVIIGLVGLSNAVNLEARTRRWRSGEANRFTSTAASAANLAALAAAATVVGKTRFAAATPLLVRATVYATTPGVLDKGLDWPANTSGAEPTWPALLARIAAHTIDQFMVNKLGGLFRPQAGFAAADAFGGVADYLVDKAAEAGETVFASVPRRPDAVSASQDGPLFPIADALDHRHGPANFNWTALTVLYLLIARLSHVGARGVLSAKLDDVAIGLISSAAFSAMCGLNEVRAATRPTLPSLANPVSDPDGVSRDALIRAYGAGRDKPRV